MARNTGDFNSGAGKPAEQPAAPTTTKTNATALLPQGPITVDQPLVPKRSAGIDYHPETGRPLPAEKWKPAWAGLKGYQEPSIIKGDGIKQVGSLRVIPKQKGGAYIRPRDLGERPVKPHREVDTDGTAISLSPQQKKENDLAIESASNWDRHMDVANAHSEARTSIERQQALAAAAERTAQNSTQIGADEAEIPDEMLFTGGGLREHLGSLREIHASVAHLAPHALAHGRTATRLAVNAANQSQSIAARLNERKADGSLKHPEGSESRENLMNGINKSDEDSNVFASFSKRHITVMNHVATAKAVMDNAERALRSSRDEDATRLLGEAAGHLTRVVKHLAAPMTQRVLREHTGFVSSAHHDFMDKATGSATSNPVPNIVSSGDASAILGNVTEELVQRPMNQPRVKDENATIKFNKGGFIHTYTLDKKGEEKVKKHFGIRHANYFKFKDAVKANRVKRTPVSQLGMDVAEEPAVRQQYDIEGKPVGEPIRVTTQVRKPAERPVEAAPAENKPKVGPKPSTTLPSDLQKHTKIAVAHGQAGLQVPYETQRVLGTDALGQIAAHVKEKHGKDLIL